MDDSAMEALEEIRLEEARQEYYQRLDYEEAHNDED